MPEVAKALKEEKKDKKQKPHASREPCVALDPPTGGAASASHAHLQLPGVGGGSAVDLDNHQNQSLRAEVRRLVTSEVIAATGAKLDTLSESITDKLASKVVASVADALAPTLAKLDVVREGWAQVPALAEKPLCTKAQETVAMQFKRCQQQLGEFGSRMQEHPVTPDEYEAAISELRRDVQALEGELVVANDEAQTVDISNSGFDREVGPRLVRICAVAPRPRFDRQAAGWRPLQRRRRRC
ncbi:unnamed protein product [Prorocentrum cordatum]|uniref:Tubulin-specific chaperone A n=1 Tax=Prorocentrum cordatum TaxID=2364126 RepID=A0ABN9S8J2_9DINO|nr:unnamed protein product [Polarella glacialis]